MFKHKDFFADKGKSDPVMAYSVFFQGKHFRKCHGLLYWFTYGDYVFDTRMMREYLGLEQEPLDEVVKSGRENFESRLDPIIHELEEQNAMEVFMDMDKWYEEYHAHQDNFPT